MRICDLAERSVGLLGFGAEGRSTLAALRRAGHRGELAVLEDGPSEAAALGIASLSGDDAVTFARRVDVLVKSPGVKPSHRALLAARGAGVVVTTATNLYLAEIRDAGLRVVGVTGSKGKSTTATLIHRALVAAGRESALAGNIGAPALDVLDDVLARRAITVFELSSYQCHDLECGPDVAVLLNLFPEHMDWHGSLAAYYDAKCRIAATQSSAGVTIHDAASAEIRNRLPLGLARHVPFGEPPGVHFADGWFLRGDERLFRDDRMRLPGLHNRRNACAALACALELSVDAGALEAALAGFDGLPHRLEDVAGGGGIRWIDDSISTAPESAAAALEAFRGTVGALIAGGHDRGYDFAPLVDAILADAVPVVVCLPPSGARLARDLRARTGSTVPRVFEAADLAEAVAIAARETEPGRTCLLSPASPSYGAFRDFQERGMRFRELIGRI